MGNGKPDAAAARLIYVWRAEAHDIDIGQRCLVAIPVDAAEQRFRILGQVAGKDRRLAIAIEGLAIDGFTCYRRADDDRQARGRPGARSPRGWRARKRAP